jgi:hypothetical protein
MVSSSKKPSLVSKKSDTRYVQLSRPGAHSYHVAPSPDRALSGKKKGRENPTPRVRTPFAAD